MAKSLRFLHSAATPRLLSSSSFDFSPSRSPPLDLPDPAAATVTSPSQGILRLDDVETLFPLFQTRELLKTALNLHLVAIGPLVDVGSSLMKSGAMRIGIFRRIVKGTVYEHFCAGEDVEEASETLRDLWKKGLRGILDYGLEDADGDQGCEKNLGEFLRTIEMTATLPPSSVSFACVKITAICPISLLKRVSDLLRWKHQDSTFYLPWKHEDSLPILTSLSPMYHTPSPPPPLTQSEELALRSAQSRLHKLAKKSREMNVPLLVDAEYTSVQPAIDYLTYVASVLFNKGDDPVVYGTIQTYLRDAKDRLFRVTEEAERRGVSMGFKLVRGAYFSSETKVAASLSAQSPIHSSIEKTHECYDACAAFMLEKVARGSGSVVLATHNVDSGKAAAAKAEELGISKGNHRLQFAQLKGMADCLSLGLKNAGFNVSKYLAYGPLDSVIPFLLRRAEENRGLLSASSFDRKLIRKELKRRLRASVFG